MPHDLKRHPWRYAAFGLAVLAAVAAFVLSRHHDGYHGPTSADRYKRCMLQAGARAVASAADKRAVIRDVGRGGYISVSGVGLLGPGPGGAVDVFAKDRGGYDPGGPPMAELVVLTVHPDDLEYRLGGATSGKPLSTSLARVLSTESNATAFAIPASLAHDELDARTRSTLATTTASPDNQAVGPSNLYRPRPDSARRSPRGATGATASNEPDTVGLAEGRRPVHELTSDDLLLAMKSADRPPGQMERMAPPSTGIIAPVT
jgi:hypothetical protein